MKLDKDQKLVVDCNQNAVVSAGAGSGKTTVLARRFLRLIEDGSAGVAEILTLTFTRKAASEMYERIYKLLIEQKNSPAAARASADFEKASISTLDSFCARIARDCSTSFGVAPSFKTDENLVRKLAEETALDFMLENMDDPFLQEFVFMNGFDNVRNNFFVYISMNYLSMGNPQDFDLIFEKQMESVNRVIDEQLRKIRALLAEIKSFDTELKGVKKIQEELSGFESESIQELKAGLPLLRVGKPRGNSKQIEFIRCKKILDELRPAADTVEELISTIENKELIEGLFSLTADFQDLLFSRKRFAGLLGFHDVLSIAVSGLKNDKELRAYYKSLYRFIMIDEFQDNNSLQKELLYLLAEKDGEEGDGVPEAGSLNPEKLFFVGDEKQSIYRFRGADVSVFKQLSSELEQAGGVSLSLKKNYRSEPDLINLFNDLFMHVMRDSEEDYQAEFEPLEARESLMKTSPEIRLLYKPYDSHPDEEALSSVESEAYAIADYIKEAVGRLEITESGENRKAEYSDFAMLFRSGTNQKTYEQVFRARGIPYTVHSVRSLFQEAPVNDIYNLLQICIYPDDRQASAAYLRSPFVNISDLSLAAFMNSDKPVFAEDQQTCCVTESDLIKYNTAKELFCEVSDLVDKIPASEIVTTIWYKSGYRYLLLNDYSQHGYIEHYDYLHKLAGIVDDGGGSTADFLDKIRENLGEYKKLDELRIMGYTSAGVNIMPVHQSKGLEFPVVIIANSGNKGRNSTGGSEPAYICDEYGLSFNLVSGEGLSDSKRLNYFYNRGREESQAKDDAELRRLLYVALTRAENHLVISGCHGQNNRNDEKSMLNLFLSAYGCLGEADPQSCPGLEKYTHIIKSLNWNERGFVSGRTADIQSVSGAYSMVNPVEYIFEQNSFSASALNAESREESSDDTGRQLDALPDAVEVMLTDNSKEADFGTLCHRIIEHRINAGTVNCSDADLPPDKREFLLGLFKDAADADGLSLLLDTAWKLGSVFFGSDIWKNSESALNIESELAITSSGEKNGRRIYINGIIDLVIETEDQVHVVDFKTDRRIIEGEYSTQLQIYKEAASAIYSKPAVCSLYYLRSGIEIPVL